MKYPTFWSAASIAFMTTLHPALADPVLAYSNFSVDLDGWTSNTPAEISWVPTGGDSKGAVKFSDQTGNSTYLIAPAKFLSPTVNYTSLSGKGYITWEHRIASEAEVTSTSPYEIRLSGPNGAAKFDGGLPLGTPNTWMTVTAPLQQADWTVTSGTWAGLLANVTNMQIDIELVTNSNVGEDVELIDNVQVVSHVAGFAPAPK